jgi:hypothetical protein
MRTGQYVMLLKERQSPQHLSLQTLQNICTKENKTRIFDEGCKKLIAKRFLNKNHQLQRHVFV